MKVLHVVRATPSEDEEEGRDGDGDAEEEEEEEGEEGEDDFGGEGGAAVGGGCRIS